MSYLDNNFWKPQGMLGYFHFAVNERDDYFRVMQIPAIFEEPNVIIGERDVVSTKCPSCHIMQDNLRQCNSCHQPIPESAIRTLIKGNGQACNITGLNPVYSHRPPPPEPDNRVQHCSVRNPFKPKKEARDHPFKPKKEARDHPFKSKKEARDHPFKPKKEEIPVFFRHPDDSYRESLREIARTAIRKLKNNEDTPEQKMIKRCTFEKFWRYCSRCNPELWHVNTTGGKGKCTKQDLKDGMKCIIDNMQFPEEEKKKVSKKRVQLEKKTKNSTHPHCSKVMHSHSNDHSYLKEQNADIIIKEKKKNVGTKTYVTSNKLSDINAQKSQFVASTKTVGTSLKKKDNDSVQNMHMLKKQRKDAEVTVIASNKLHSTGKSVQFMNATKSVGLPQAKSQASASSKKLNVKNESNERPDTTKDTKLPCAAVKEGQFMNATKFVDLSQTSTSLKKLNIKIEPQERPGTETVTQTTVNIEKEVFKMPYLRNITSDKTNKNNSVNIPPIIPPVENKTYHAIRSPFVQKIISKDSVSSSKNIQTFSKTSFDQKKTNLDTENLIPMKNENKPKSTLPSSEKFSKPSKNVPLDLRKGNEDADNLNLAKNENKSTVMLSSSKTFSELSGNLASDQNTANLDIEMSMENENKIAVTPFLSGTGNLASDQNTANLDIKMSMKNENKITVIPTLSGKLSELSGNLASDQKNMDLDITKPMKDEYENKVTVLPSLSEKLSENTQKPVEKLEYPGLSEEDLKCLPDKNLLNDTIIEFYLKYIFNEKLTPELQEKTYICNPFFYPKVLMQLHDSDKTKAKSVESWLKDIDLFSKDFILIPVNVEFSPKVKHWYLVIICFLSKIEKTSLYGAHSGTTACNPETQSMLQQKPSDSEITDKRPCICFFDSAYAEKCLGEKKIKVAKNLKNFLKTLWLSTHKYEICDWTQLKSFNVKCPQQNNWYDCGIFLLQFAESFFQTPIAKFQDPINVTHWFNQSMIAEKRKEIKKIIVERMKDKNLEILYTLSPQDCKP